jgi:hypothetical protein
VTTVRLVLVFRMEKEGSRECNEYSRGQPTGGVRLTTHRKKKQHVAKCYTGRDLWTRL